MLSRVCCLVAALMAEEVSLVEPLMVPRDEWLIRPNKRAPLDVCELTHVTRSRFYVSPQHGCITCGRAAAPSRSDPKLMCICKQLPQGLPSARCQIA